MNQVQGAVLQVDVAMATASARKQLDDLKKFAGTEFARGIALSIGHRAVGMLTGAARAAMGAMTGLVQQGVAFNTTLENSEISIGALLRATAPDKMKSLPDALKEAGDAMKALRHEARYTAATFEQLLFGFQGILGAAMEAGFATGDAVKLAATISRAVNIAMPGAAPYQLLQEGRALLTGNLQGAMVARQLGITGEQVRAAKESGKLLEFLNQKLLAFNEAADVLSGTLTTTLSNIQDALDDITADATKGLFSELKEAFKVVKDAVESPGFGRFVRTMSDFTEYALEKARTKGPGAAGLTYRAWLVANPTAHAAVNDALRWSGDKQRMEQQAKAAEELQKKLAESKKVTETSKSSELLAWVRESQGLPPKETGISKSAELKAWVSAYVAKTSTKFTDLSQAWNLWAIMDARKAALGSILNTRQSSYDMGRWQSRGGYADFYQRQNLGQRVLNEVRRIREAVDKVLKVEVAGV